MPRCVGDVQDASGDGATRGSDLDQARLATGSIGSRPAGGRALRGADTRGGVPGGLLGSGGAGRFLNGHGQGYLMRAVSTLTSHGLECIGVA